MSIEGRVRSPLGENFIERSEVVVRLVLSGVLLFTEAHECIDPSQKHLAGGVRVRRLLETLRTRPALHARRTHGK